MRNKRETDISRYTDVKSDLNVSAKKPNPIKTFFKGLGKLLFTLFSIGAVAGIIAVSSIAIYLFALASEPTGIDLEAKSLNQTSFIYVQDEKGEFKEYQTLYSTENRIWVDNQDIPEAMKEAIVAIEDKRFPEHKGVDWKRTFAAVGSLLTGTDSYGGSTITQQLIKNTTGDNEVSIKRKLREICTALKLEQEYTKDQILEAYLNVVNFGNSCQGVESAAQLYFDKSIKDCSIAECAAIAGITQNPSKWNPLMYPENNKIRRDIIINEMYSQEKITKAEYEQAKKDSENMTFVGYQDDDEEDEEDEDTGYVQNWYIDELFYDAQRDLAQYYNISKDAASEKLYTEGLRIYCAMDERAQTMIEEAAVNIDKSSDSDLQIGMTLMGFDGRVIATVGSSNKKTEALSWSRAYDSSLQPGSSIKPVVVYPLAIEKKLINFSSVLPDKPLEKYELDDYGNYVPGPNNHYGYYKGDVLLPDAIEISSNATVAQVMDMDEMGPQEAYKQAVTNMGFAHLHEDDAYNAGGLSIGGLRGGVTVREMASAFTYMGNGGLYYQPYTYYYITDSEGNIIIDNRDAVPKRAYSPETAGIMNRLLHYNVNNSVTTRAGTTKIGDWDIIGKTGTTDGGKDSWFCGLSPYASLAVWTGFDDPHRISDTSVSTRTWRKVMSAYLEGMEHKEYNLPSTLTKAQYNPYTGLIVSTDDLSGQYIGYYTEDNMPTFGSWSDGYEDEWYDSDDEYTEDDSDLGGEDTGETEETVDPSAPVEEESAPIVEEPTAPVADVTQPQGGGDPPPAPEVTQPAA